MIRTRWHKVLIDLWSNRVRTLIVALAIAVGVYAVGTVVSARTLLVREFGRDQEEALVATAVIQTTPFDDAFARRIAELPGVQAAEGRSTLQARVTPEPGQRRDLLLVVISDFEEMSVDRITPLAGDWPPGQGEVILERLGTSFLGDTQLGEALTFELRDGSAQSLTVAGIAHDAQQFSPDLTDQAVGYLSTETVQKMGLVPPTMELRLRLEDTGSDDAAIQRVVDRVETEIEDSGRPVLNTAIATGSLVEKMVGTVVLLLSGFGVIILLLSGFLVVNTISALIAQQVQQIGVMKLVGARRPQVVAMYIVMVLVYGLIAIAIGVPLALLTARLLMTELVEGLINIRSNSYAVPAAIIAIQVGIGLLLPLLAGVWPVLKGTAVTTHAALNDVGLAKGGKGQTVVDRLLARVQQRWSLQRPVLLALRNMLRHKGRLLQTLLVLIMGTALFISVLSVHASVGQTLVSFQRYHQYDVVIRFDQPYPIEELVNTAGAVSSVTGVEAWSVDGAWRVRPDGSESNGFRVFALPDGSETVDPQMENGRWLHTDDERGVVINTDVARDEEDIHIGDAITLAIAGKESTWKVVGITLTDAQGPAVYVSEGDYGQVTGRTGQANQLRVAIDGHEPAVQEKMASTLVDHFESAGFTVGGSKTAESINAQNRLMFNIIVAILVMMALLLAAVGGLGLTTTMGINVLERIREIGVLRAIGASNTSLRGIVLAEGLLIGLLSWTLGTLLSVPLSAFISEQVGLALLNVPLTYAYSLTGAAAWFFAILVVATAASLGPARNAVRLTVREVLAYE